jgi:hypothetical protein
MGKQRATCCGVVICRTVALDFENDCVIRRRSEKSENARWSKTSSGRATALVSPEAAMAGYVIGIRGMRGLTKVNVSSSLTGKLRRARHQ